MFLSLSQFVLKMNVPGQCQNDKRNEGTCAVSYFPVKIILQNYPDITLFETKTASNGIPQPPPPPPPLPPRLLAPSKPLMKLSKPRAYKWDFMVPFRVAQIHIAYIKEYPHPPPRLPTPSPRGQCRPVTETSPYQRAFLQGRGRKIPRRQSILHR